MKRLIRVLLPLIVLAAGILGMRYMIKHKPKVGKRMPRALATAVDVITVNPITHPVKVTGMGVVKAASQVRIQPQVSGKVIWVSPNLVPGGRVKKGEVLCRIEDRDYRAVVAQRQAALEKARYDLLAEQGRAVVAKREWAMVKSHGVTSQAGKALALRKPQLAMAKAALTSAKSALAAAKLNVERTVLRAPFDAIVLSESVAPGQVIGPGAGVAVLAGINTYWVMVSIPAWELPWVDSETGQALVYQSGDAGQVFTRKARVLNIGGQLDTKGRMAQILLEVKNPLETSENSPIPLLIGDYVKVSIHGKTLKNVFRLPQKALRDNNRIFVMDKGVLDIRQVTPLRLEDDVVLVKGPLHAGDKVVVSRLDTAVKGMRLRAAQKEKSGE